METATDPCPYVTLTLSKPVNVRISLVGLGEVLWQKQKDFAEIIKSLKDLMEREIILNEPAQQLIL